MLVQASSRFLQIDAVFAVKFLQSDVDALAQRGLDVFADEICFDRQFTMAAVDQDGELNPFGTAKIVEGIERGACGSAPEDHVIDENDGFVGNVKWNDRGMDVGRSLLV